MAFKQLLFTGVDSVAALEPGIPKECLEDFTAADTDISKVIKNAAELQYYLQMVMAGDLFRRVGTSPLNLWAMKAELGKLIPSTFEEPTATTKNKALNYMELVLFNIAPTTRQVKAGVDSDKHWNIRAYHTLSILQIQEYIAHAINSYNSMVGAGPKIGDNMQDHQVGRLINAMKDHWMNCPKSGEGEETVYHVAGTVTLATFKSSAAPMEAPNVGEHKSMILTIKQASLLALDLLNDYTEIALAMNIIVLTPLAGAVFARSSIPTMMEEESIKTALVNE